MAVPTPFVGFNFSHSTNSLRDVISANSMSLESATISTTGGDGIQGLLCDGTGERGYMALSAGSLPTAWPITLHVRLSIATTANAYGILGLMRGSAGSADRGTAYGATSTGTNLELWRNNTAGTGVVLTSGVGTFTKGASSTDYTDREDFFLVFKSANNASYTRVNGTTVTDAGSSVSTAPLYNNPRFYLGNMPWSVGNCRSKYFQAGMWAGELSGAEMDEIIVDPVAAYLSVYNSPKRKKQSVSVSLGLSTMDRVSKTITIPGPAYIDNGGSGSTGGASLESAFWRNRRRVR